MGAEKLSAAQAVEILQDDQLWRWRNGERVPAETYLQILNERFADGSRNDGEECFDLIYAELLLRSELGDRPSTSEYLWRFPEFSKQLLMVDELEGHLETDLARGSDAAALLQPPAGRQSAETLRWPVIPGYEILGELGRGGMGVVYEARQASLQRLVALKLIRAGGDTDPAALARFRVEAEAVAQLQHPNIVQIYEIGGLDALPNGCPFMALELVQGGNLARLVASGEWRAGRKKGHHKTAELVAAIARAMHHAHQHGILHRDLKPGNILLQKSEVRSQKSEDGGGWTRPPLTSDLRLPTSDLWPKITDFGLAKRLEEGSAAHTRTGSLLGTPSYMAPEQAAGLTREIGVATDVYALGAILCELLTGQPPFMAETPLATLELVRNAEPVAPVRLEPTVPPDLETICLKCLQKESPKRYPSALALAEDLERYVGHEPIQARRVGAAGRVTRWCRRNPTLAATLGVATIVVSMVASIGLWGVVEERDHYRQERDHSQANLYRALVGEARSQIDAHDTGWWSRALDNVREAATLDVAGRDPAALRDLAIECMGSRYPCFRLQGVWSGHTGPVTAVTVSRDGRVVATGSRDKTVRLWSMPEGKPLAVLSGHEGTVTGLAIQPNGRLLASCSMDGSIRIWNLASTAAILLGTRTGESSSSEVRQLKAGRVNSVAISPDGAWLAAGCQDATVHVFSLAADNDPARAASALDDSRERHRVLKGDSGPIRCVAFSPAGELASSGEDRTIGFWNVVSGQLSLSWSVRDTATAMSFIAWPKRIAARGAAQLETLGYLNVLAWTEPQHYGFRLRNRRSGLEVGSPFNAHSGPVMQLDWNDEGDVLSASQDGSLKVWYYASNSTLEELAIARGEYGAIHTARFSPDGDSVVAGYSDGRVRLWQLAEPPQRLVVNTDSQNAVFVGGERRLVDSRKVFDFATGLNPRGRLYAPDAVQGLAIHPAVHRFAFSSKGSIRLWNLHDRREVSQWQAHDQEILALAGSADGRQLASASADGTVKLWSWETQRLHQTLAPAAGRLHALAWSSDSRQLAVTGERGAVVWDVDVPAQPRLRFQHDLPMSAVAFGRNVLALSGAEGGIALCDPQSGRLLRTLRGHKGGVRSLAFSPDGTLLASGATGDAVRLWNVAQGTEVAALNVAAKGYAILATWLEFDPLRRYLCVDYPQIWDFRSNKIVCSILQSRFTVSRHRFRVGAVRGRAAVGSR